MPQQDRQQTARHEHHRSRGRIAETRQAISHRTSTGLAAPREPQVPTAESSHRPKLVNATITASIQYWLRTASSGSSYMHQRAVVRQRQAADVAGHERRDLHVPDRRIGDHVVVDLIAARAEHVRAVAERVGGQIDDRLALPDQQREVVREHVGEADRHERVRERVRQLAGVIARADAAHAHDSDPVDRRDQQDAEHQPDRVGELVALASGRSRARRTRSAGSARCCARRRRC